MSATQASVSATQASVSATQASMNETRILVAHLQAGQVLSSPSRAELGRSVWEACQSKSEGISEASRIHAPTPLLTQAEHEALKERYKANSGSRENVWVALLTPRLMELVASFSPRKLLVNSELIGWVRTEADISNLFQKPDLFVCDPVAYVADAQPRTTDKSSASSKYAATLRTGAFVFGSCAWPLRDAVLCLLEAKVKIDLHEAIGEIFSKVQNLLRGTTMASFKCCLFDMESMYLFTFTNTGLLSSQHFPLIAPGSFRTVADFICPPSVIEPVWLRTVRQLCTAFDVEPVDGSAFLGSGAHGKVFRVQSHLSVSAASSGASSAVSPSHAVIPFALKIVDHRHQDSLDAEHLKLQRLLTSTANRLSILPTFVSPKVQHAIDPSSGSPLGSGLLLQPVGRWVWAERPSNIQAALYEVLDALVQLHQLDVVHGDARLENLLRVDDRLVWIDFRECQIEASQELQRWWDLRTCLNNFIRHCRGDRTQQLEFEDLQEQYARLSLFASGPSASSPDWPQFKQTVWKRIALSTT